ncbi:MAG: type II secretion system protein [Sulfurospirillaceae bacterium]|nr:type II secretion system protein [Sulfurospirillaceae bacterium]
MKRSGFGLIQTLLIIILVSGLLVVAMKYAKITIKQTGDIYAKESAELFMKSALETSLLAISGYQRNATNGCLKEINVTSADDRFFADINISKYYLLNGSQDCNYCGSLCKPISTEESSGMVMLKVHVMTNPKNPKNKNKNISLYMRTLQKP